MTGLEVYANIRVQLKCFVVCSSSLIWVLENWIMTIIKEKKHTMNVKPSLHPVFRISDNRHIRVEASEECPEAFVLLSTSFLFTAFQIEDLDLHAYTEESVAVLKVLQLFLKIVQVSRTKQYTLRWITSR